MPIIHLFDATDPRATLDQARHGEGVFDIYLHHSGDGNINVINPGDASDVLNLRVFDTIAGRDKNFNIGDGASVNLNGLTYMWMTGSPPAQLNYNIGNGSTLELSATSAMAVNQHIVNVNLGDGAATLIYNPTFPLPTSGVPNINGLTAGDQIRVVGATGGAYSNGQLTFFNQDGVVANFSAPGLDENEFAFSGDTMTYACYLKGTHIATPHGETKVEDLQAGDEVSTASGGVATVKWIGYRTLRKARIPAKDAIRAFPVTFAKDAIAPNVPHRDLTMSPGHHVFFDGQLIPAMLLVNGKTITQDFTRAVFEYFHVELDRFDILLAEGVHAESYVDTGNRSMFQNAQTAAMYPDFGPAEGRPAAPGIEVLRSGPAVKAIRQCLLRRAEVLTHSLRVTDPQLRIEINGQEVQPETTGQREGVMRFVLPPSTHVSDVRILSRSAVVRDVTVDARRDLRQIGVGLARITVEDAAGRRDIDLNNAQLSGLHGPQDLHGVAMRWSNGAATIPAALLNLTGHSVLELHVLRTYSYWEAAQARAA